jgi:hypothetical protein
MNISIWRRGERSFQCNVYIPAITPDSLKV